MARTVSIPPIESFGRLTQLLTVQDGRAVIDLTEEARKENSAGETVGATTTIILEPARISGSTVEPSRREIARKRRKERCLSWALVLGMLVFAVFWLLGMQLVSWLAVGVPLMWRLILAVSSLVFAAVSMFPSLVYAFRRERKN